MKNIKSLFVLPILAAMTLVSCEKPDTKVTFLGGTAPVLTASSTGALTLSQPQSAYSSLQLQWTDPNYQFSNGVNTQDVYYTLQIDLDTTAWVTFSNPNTVQIPVTAQLSTSFTVKSLDDYLGQLQLSTSVAHNYAFRIMATLASTGIAVTGDNVPLYSNVVQIMIAPYLDVVYPVPAALFITGTATAGGWMASGDPVLATQQFTKVNAFKFVLSNFQVNGGQEFLLVPVYGNWNNKYGTVGANDTNNPSGDYFVPGGNNFIAPAASGSYTITVNFATGKYSIQ
jgi:starch-binding outer membrane protein SusE/F